MAGSSARNLAEHWHLFEAWDSVEKLDGILNAKGTTENVPGFFVPINRIAVGLIAAKLSEKPGFDDLETRYLASATTLQNGFYLDRVRALADALERG